ncbi:MAG: hypothetical protein Q9178_007346 [Gyalolechia marmorata]
MASHPPGHEPFAPTTVDSARDDGERMYAKYMASKTHIPSKAKVDHIKSEPSDLNGDILRIVPINTQARRAFDSLVRLKEAGKLHEAHAQHLHVTGMAPLDPCSDDALIESGVTTDEALSDHEARQRIVHRGYFRVRFNLPKVSKAPVWFIGKGSGRLFGPSRNVDILLAAPGSKDACGVRAAHTYLDIHRTSGA